MPWPWSMILWIISHKMIIQQQKKWARELIRSTDKLSDHPPLGRIVPEFNEETLRELIVGNYRIVYRIKTDVLYIEAVWHVHQRPDTPPNS